MAQYCKGILLFTAYVVLLSKIFCSNAHGISAVAISENLTQHIHGDTISHTHAKTRTAQEVRGEAHGFRASDERNLTFTQHHVFSRCKNRLQS